MEYVAGAGEDALVFQMILENQVKEPTFRETVLRLGWASEAELDAISDSASSFAQRPDVFGFIVFVQALGFV
jgi:hypothetical protein